MNFYSAVDVITTKRDGGVLSDGAITWMLDAYVRGEVAEEQMSSLLMAIYFNGLSSDELNCWTDRMIESGERLDLSGLSRPTVDKHSTGGVGDKISLILAPPRGVVRSGRATAVRSRTGPHRRHARQT